MDPGAGLGRVALLEHPQSRAPPGKSKPRRVPRAPRCRSNPTHPTGMARGRLGFATTGSDVFHLPSEDGVNQAAMRGRRQPVGSARGDGSRDPWVRATYLPSSPTAGPPPWRFCCASCSCAEWWVSRGAVLSSGPPPGQPSAPAARGHPEQ